MKQVLFWIVASCAMLPSLCAQTNDLINPDRPGIADGSMTVARGTFQFEVGVERDHRRDGGVDDRLLETPALFRFGLTKNVELRIEGLGDQNEKIDQSHSRELRSGIAPVSIGAKVHLLDDDAATHRPSVGVIARLFLPSGSGSFSSTGFSGDVRLAADLALGSRWALNPNVGLSIAKDDDGRRFAAALAAMTLQFNIDERRNLFVDAGLQSPESHGGTDALIADAGGAWIVGNDMQFDVSVGWGAHGDTTPNIFFAAGFSRRF